MGSYNEETQEFPCTNNAIGDDKVNDDNNSLVPKRRYLHLNKHNTKVNVQ